jgi:hypothetical protein
MPKDNARIAAGTAVGRRGFIGALAGLSASAAALVGSGAVSPAAAQESDDEMVKARYQETEHVVRFYEVNAYETKQS